MSGWVNPLKRKICNENIFSDVVWSSKNTNRGGWGHTFLSIPWNVLFIYFTPENSRQMKAPPLEIVQTCVTSLLGNSKTKNQNPWKFHIIFSWSALKFHMLFLWYPWKFHILNLPSLLPPACFFFFFSGIVQCKEVVYLFFIWFSLAFHPSWFCPLKSGRWVGGGGLLNRQNPQAWRKLFVDIIPKLTVCVKPIIYIQENTLGG